MHKFFMKTWARFVKGLYDNHFIRFGFMMNDGIWIHMIGGGILAKVFNVYFLPSTSILIILGIAILWEFIEAYIETPNKNAIINIYGSIERYVYDSIGDILGAVIIAMLVVL